MGACPKHSGALLHVDGRGRRPAQEHVRVPPADVNSDWTTLTGTSIMSERTDRSCVLDAPVDVTEKRMRIRDFKGIFVYHSPQYPGYTCF